MHTDFFKNWAVEAWTLMTAWWTEADIVEKSNQLIEDLGEEAALAEATKNALDVTASFESRYLWNKILVCVSQELWRRHLTF